MGSPSMTSKPFGAKFVTSAGASRQTGYEQLQDVADNVSMVDRPESDSSPRHDPACTTLIQTETSFIVERTKMEVDDEGQTVEVQVGASVALRTAQEHPSRIGEQRRKPTLARQLQAALQERRIQVGLPARVVLAT